jgi:hypothetical protein
VLVFSRADPDAEVIALSPGTLMATNRFVCEVCGKGFQRDQNLQLHRRGHNLPWRLRQRGPGAAPPRRRVYVCPEPGCVHHSPARALGDLTGIKKHFCRKHGEKRWACPRCGKRYAVQADLKAHAKTCGTREYRCDCGTLFTRYCCFELPFFFSPITLRGGKMFAFLFHPFITRGMPAGLIQAGQLRDTSSILWRSRGGDWQSARCSCPAFSPPA